MHISIETVQGKRIKLEVEDSSKTIDLKIDGPTRKLVIRLGSNPDRGRFQIFVKTLQGKTITLNVKKSHTIRKVKAMYEKEEDVPVNQQRMIYRGTELEEHRTVADCNIEKEATLVMVTRLCGC